MLGFLPAGRCRVGVRSAPGTLSITATGGTIGTAGVVYDTSNGVEGTVSFSGHDADAAPMLAIVDSADDTQTDVTLGWLALIQVVSQAEMAAGGSGSPLAT